MGMSAFYGTPKPEEDMIALMQHAVDSGITFFDTSDMYGPHTNEILVGKVNFIRNNSAALIKDEKVLGLKSLHCVGSELAMLNRTLEGTRRYWKGKILPSFVSRQNDIAQQEVILLRDDTCQH